MREDRLGFILIRTDKSDGSFRSTVWPEHVDLRVTDGIGFAMHVLEKSRELLLTFDGNLDVLIHEDDRAFIRTSMFPFLLHWSIRHLVVNVPLNVILDQQQISSKITDVVDDPILSPVLVVSLEHVISIPLDGFFDPIPLAREHHVRADPSAPAPRVAIVSSFHDEDVYVVQSKIREP